MAECYTIVSRDYMRGIVTSLLFSFVITLYASYTKDEILMSWITLYGLFLPVLVMTSLFVNLYFSSAEGCPSEVTFPEEPELRVLYGLAAGAIIIFPITLIVATLVTVPFNVQFTVATGAEAVVVAVMLQWAIAHWENGVIYFVPDTLSRLSGGGRLIFVILVGALMGSLHQWAYGNLLLTLTSTTFFTSIGLIYHGYIPLAPSREPEGFVLVHFLWNCIILANLVSTMPGILAVLGLVAFLFMTGRIR